MNKVVVRALSGAVYVALIVVCTLAGGWFFFALMGMFMVIAMLEYQNLTAHRDRARQPILIRALDMTSALLLLFMTAILASALNCGGIDFGSTPVLNILVCGLALLIICLMARLSLSLCVQKGDAVTSCASSVTGFFYIALPLNLLCLDGMLLPLGSNSWGIGDGGIFGNPGMFRNAILTTFILIWLNDTGAFCFGCTLGKHKLCERLSPKKSWEGFWGGFGCCVIAGALLAQWAGLPSWWVGALFGVCVSVLSTWGDLFESQLKRTAGVKDAGNLIPGHGGILDRIDSLLFVAPALFIFMMLSSMH